MQKFCKFFCKPTKLTLPEVHPPSVIPFCKPLITPDLDLPLFPHHHEVILTFIQKESFGEVCVFQGEDKSSHPRFSLDTVDSRLVKYYFLIEYLFIITWHYKDLRLDMKGCRHHEQSSWVRVESSMTEVKRSSLAPAWLTVGLDLILGTFVNPLVFVKIETEWFNIWAQAWWWALTKDDRLWRRSLKILW